MMRILFIIACTLAFASCAATKKQVSPPVQVAVVYEPGGAYSSMRIPALVSTKQGSLLAFCEGRLGSSGDWADINLLMRRSVDGGKSWSSFFVIDSMKVGPAGNPVTIVDDRGRIHILYQKDYATAWYRYSDDDGKNWSPARNITATFEAFKPEYNWNVLAPGPGHGIQLRNGRLLSAVWLAESAVTEPRRAHAPSATATIFSDDYGLTWQRGALIANHSDSIANPNESMPVQLENGEVLMSIRNTGEVKRRAFSRSASGTGGWQDLRFADELFDPTCMAPILAFRLGNQRALLFVNPDSRDIPGTPRQNLSTKLSFDGGATWGKNKVLDAGPAGYSDLAEGRDGNIYVLYETNTVSTGFNYSLVLMKISKDWLLE